MSKIKLVDFIKINPDPSYADLSSRDKVQVIDSLFNRSEDKRGLLVTYDLSHSGRRINNRIYTVAGQQAGIHSLLNPYPKPIIRNHDDQSEPIGRFVSGYWDDASEDAISFFDNVNDYMYLQSAFDADDPERIYKAMKKYGLLTRRNWPGLGRMRVTARISDQDAIEKFLDGRYITFSAGSTTDRHVCSICQNDWALGDLCDHRHGKVYDKDLCVFVTGKFEVLEGSVVNMPADDLSQVLSMELSDSVRIEDVSTIKVDKHTVYLTDSMYSIKDTEETDAKKEYDHMLKIPEKAMQELHSSGQSDVVTRSGNEEMTIRLMYDHKESDSISDVIDDIIAAEDEKKFKVPAGARGNAKKVLEWKKKYGSEVKGMTPVGWARARQLASQSEIGLSTVKRMAAFNRHRKNAAVDPKFKSEPWKDRGYVAWLGWGGTSGIDWAVKISAANDSLDTPELDAKRSSPKGKGAKTPAEPSERRKGSSKNKKGSASKGNSKISVGSAEASLKEKVASHNKKYGSQKGKRVTLGMLKAVWRRGAGAFSSTHRPSMSRAGWAMARVNAFLKLVRSGRPSNPKYTTDNDLLPAGHPRKSKGKE